MALADYEMPINFELVGEYPWNDDYDRLSIVRQAMWVINNRFLDVENVVQNVLDVTTNGYSFQMESWNELSPHFPEMTLGDHLLWYQLRTLRNWMSPPDARSGPTLYIHSAYQEQDIFAWAPFNTVHVSGDGDTYRVEGDFEIYLNFYMLGAGGLNSDPWSWASTIAHEMLHNLGHAHEHVSHPSYQRQQINVFTAALYYGNRQYQYGMRTPDVRCGGRYP